MNEEIERILRMLDEGKINAADAERLIRAVRSEAAPQDAEWREWPDWSAPRPSPCIELKEKVRTVRRAVRAARDRQRRHAVRYAVWCMHHLKRKSERDRRKRSENRTTVDRVIYVLTASAVVATTPEAGSLVKDLLQGDQFAWDNFYFGLEEEFRIDIPPRDLHDLITVQSVADYIDRRLAEPPAPVATEEPLAETPPEETVTEEEPPRAPKRRGGKKPSQPA
jgi:hypothetical protein